MKTAISKFALAASIALASAFAFFGCDNGGGDNSGGSSGGMSGLPEQLYIIEVIDGNASCSENGGCVGPIYGNTYAYSGNGDISFSLYDDEGNKKTFSAGKIQNGKMALDLPEIPSGYSKHNDGNNVDIDGIDLTGRFFVSVSGVGNNGSCGLGLQSSKAGEWAIFYYSFKEQRFEDGSSLSEGWHVIYGIGDTSSLNSKILKGELQWQARCYISTGE